MQDIKTIDLILKIKEMRQDADIAQHKSVLFGHEAKVIREQAKSIESEFKDCLDQYKKA
jgi:hypothetical protein